MRLRDKRKSQLRELAKTGTTVKLIALLWEARMNPVDEWEKKWAEAYLTNRARLTRDDTITEDTEEIEEESDPFA